MTDSSEALTDRLVDSGLLHEADAGELAVTDEFERARAALDDEVSEQAVDEFEADARSRLDAPDVVTRDLAVTAFAAETFFDGLSSAERLAVALAVDRIAASEDLDSVPAAFTPLRGFEIEPFVDSRPAVAVVFWRDDCDPCDEVFAELEELVAESAVPDGVELAAVYGPECAAFVREEFSVAGAPTTLFFADGRVATRLIGRPRPGKLRREMELLAEEAASAG